MRKENRRQLFKHQVLITGILVTAIVITTFGGSYAWFNSQAMNDEYNVFKEEDFEISYVDNGTGYGDILSLVSKNMISDQEGSSLKPYRFNVTNTGSQEKNFLLKIDLDQSIIEQDQCMGKLLSTSNIKYQLDNEQPKILGTLEQNDYVIYVSNESIMPGSSEIHELRIWIDQNSPSVVSKEHFHAKVMVETANKIKTYASYQAGQAVTLLDGTKYHVIENSDQNASKVKLLSDYNITNQGTQDQSCLTTKFINSKVAEAERNLYCSTMTFEEATSVLYREYLTKLQTNLKDFNTRIDNVEVRSIHNRELLALLNNRGFEKIPKAELTGLNWLTNLNFWTSTPNNQDNNYYWTFSADQSSIVLQEHEKESKYFGLRPVIIIDKENIKK